MLEIERIKGVGNGDSQTKVVQLKAELEERMADVKQCRTK